MEKDKEACSVIKEGGEQWKDESGSVPEANELPKKL